MFQKISQIQPHLSKGGMKMPHGMTAGHPRRLRTHLPLSRRQTTGRRSRCSTPVVVSSMDSLIYLNLNLCLKMPLISIADYSDCDKSLAVASPVPLMAASASPAPIS